MKGSGGSGASLTVFRRRMKCASRAAIPGILPDGHNLPRRESLIKAISRVRAPAFTIFAAILTLVKQVRNKNQGICGRNFKAVRHSRIGYMVY